MNLLKSIWTRRQFGLSLLECLWWVGFGLVIGYAFAQLSVPVGCGPGN